jgi:endo-1,3-1,4-beta-glycanase ExoK
MLRKVLILVLFAQSLVYSAITVQSAEIASLDQLLYGRWEVRVKTAQGEGIVNAFFTYENDSWIKGTGNPWREIDVEVLGRYTDKWQSNIITGTAETRITSEFFPSTEGVNPALAYHTYTVEWTPDYISYSFDGKQVRKTEAGDAKKQIADCRDIPQSYRFNFWANAIVDWVGTFKSNSLPLYMFVNWIKYYTYSTQSKTFTLAWTDNFDSFNTGRWSKATHTIEDFTQFAASNAFVKDGTLVLAMTDLQETGLTDVVVPEDAGTKSVIKKKETDRSSNNSVINRSGQVICFVQTVVPEKVALELIDLNGKMIDSRIVSISSGSHELTLCKNTGEQLASGAYMVKLKVGGQTSIHRVSVSE